MSRTVPAHRAGIRIYGKFSRPAQMAEPKSEYAFATRRESAISAVLGEQKLGDACVVAFAGHSTHSARSAEWMDTRKVGHYCLLGVHERAKIVGGNLTVQSELDVVDLRVPADTAYTAVRTASWLSQTFAGGD